MSIPFYKCNANGNSFIIVIGNNVNKEFFNKQNIKEICFTKDKEIVDGFIYVSIIDNKFIMDYYNNDGTWETLCVNGLKCVSKLISINFNNNNSIIESNNILYSTKILEKNLIEIELEEPCYKSTNLKVDKFKGDFINSGAKHFVVKYNANWPETEKLEKISRLIRFNSLIFPNGVNVNFYKVIDYNTIEVKTYEKGIESMMASCASGSYACAYDFSKKQNISGKINIINDGGFFNIIFNKNYKKNKLIGTAKIEYKGVL